VYRDEPQLLSNVRRALAGALAGESFTEVVEVNDLVFETHYIPVLDGGQVAGVNGVAINITERKRAELAAGLPPVRGDRVQLQQVILNLVMNGIEAMKELTDRPRELLIKSRLHESGKVLVGVRDSGVGLDPQSMDRLFEAFYTTKPDGMGMGLSISRSIIETHGGRLWATANGDHGATFQFTLPTDDGNQHD
jgi:signal transduction histidine kinase